MQPSSVKLYKHQIKTCASHVVAADSNVSGVTKGQRQTSLRSTQRCKDKSTVPCFLPFLPSNSFFWAAMEIQSAGSSEMSQSNYQSTQRHTLQDFNHQQCSENVKSYMTKIVQSKFPTVICEPAVRRASILHTAINFRIDFY